MKEMELKYVDIDKITSWPEQYRETMERDLLRELANSMKEEGILAPLWVRPKGNKFEIIAGHRRWEAAKIANITKVPVVIRDATDKQLMVLSLIENIQREDLKELEEAKAFKALQEDTKWTVAEMSEKLGKGVNYIRERMNLVEKLAKPVQNEVRSAKISFSHAREIAKIDDKGIQREVAQKIEDEEIPAGRPTERLVKVITKAPELIRKAVLADKIDIEDVESLVDHGIPKEMIKPTIEEMTKRKEEREEMREIAKETDLAVIKGERTPTRITIERSADEKRLQKFMVIRDTVRFWSVTDLNMIKSEDLRNKAIQYITDVRDRCEFVLRNLKP
jgi:ParB family chromosome partitioning protein